MNTKQILSQINSNGGFCNINNWNKKEIAEWVVTNYNCSKCVAQKVANNL